MIPPQLAMLLAQYGTKILIYCGAFLVIVAGYYYWHHQVYQLGYDEADSLYKARDARDAITAVGIMDAAKKAAIDKTLEHEQILTGVLTHNAETIKTLNARHVDDLSRSVLIATKANAGSGNTLPGKAGVLKSNDSGGQGSCEQELAEDSKRKLISAEYQIARLADLHLTCIDQIERTHTLK